MSSRRNWRRGRRDRFGARDEYDRGADVAGDPAI